MRFFVVSPDGQRYGPADLGTLGQWVREGRILPTHLLEEEGTGRRVQADQMPGLFQTTQTTYQNPPSGSPFIPTPGMSSIVPSMEEEQLVSKAYNMGYIALALGLTVGACCMPLGLAAGVCAAVGASQAMNAKKLGSSRAQGALVLCMIALAIAILTLLGHNFLQSLVTWRP